MPFTNMGGVPFYKIRYSYFQVKAAWGNNKPSIWSYLTWGTSSLPMKDK
jgi:hypothetical protein